MENRGTFGGVFDEIVSDFLPLHDFAEICGQPIRKKSEVKLFDFLEIVSCVVPFSPIFANRVRFFPATTICVKSGPLCGQNVPDFRIIGLKKTDSKIGTIIESRTSIHHNHLLASDLRNNIGPKK